jgi:NADPH-dependent 2,4-dienoyl-CoA reductase/sulfur reductase-like enzyme
VQNGAVKANGKPIANGHSQGDFVNGHTESKPLGSYPPSDIDVIIVGTGLAGLTASIECVRKGHNVKVLERNATINTAGKIIHNIFKVLSI